MHTEAHAGSDWKRDNMRRSASQMVVTVTLRRSQHRVLHGADFYAKLQLRRLPHQHTAFCKVETKVECPHMLARAGSAATEAGQDNARVVGHTCVPQSTSA